MVVDLSTQLSVPSIGAMPLQYAPTGTSGLVKGSFLSVPSIGAMPLQFAKKDIRSAQLALLSVPSIGAMPLQSIKT